MHQKNEGRRDALLLAASKFHHEKYKDELTRWGTLAIVHEEPDVPDNREQSLARLRVWVVDRCDAMIGIGGKWWKENRGIAGVPQEFELARKRGLPCLLPGGLGGAAADYLRERLEVLRNLHNGLDETQNIAFAAEENVGALTARVFEQFCRLPLVRGEKSTGDCEFAFVVGLSPEAA